MSSLMNGSQLELSYEIYMGRWEWNRWWKTAETLECFTANIMMHNDSAFEQNVLLVKHVNGVFSLTQDETLSSNVQKIVGARVVYLWHSAASKNPFENGEAASNDHVVADVLHDASGLASHQSEQDRGWRNGRRPYLLVFKGI